MHGRNCWILVILAGILSSLMVMNERPARNYHLVQSKFHFPKMIVLKGVRKVWAKATTIRECRLSWLDNQKMLLQKKLLRMRQLVTFQFHPYKNRQQLEMDLTISESIPLFGDVPLWVYFSLIFVVALLFNLSSSLPKLFANNLSLLLEMGP